VQIDVLINIPQGSRNKYEKDPATDETQLDPTLCTPVRYPLDGESSGQGTPARKRIADRGPPARPGRPRPSVYDPIGTRDACHKRFSHASRLAKLDRASEARTSFPLASAALPPLRCRFRRNGHRTQ
jgi:hypothetical protein